MERQINFKMMKEELRNYEMLSYVCPCRPALLCLLFILFFCLHFFHYHMKLPIIDGKN
uniref:Uncharacterized protein n=1 Tax=Meloidogyne enterolobii TaxID=390850 RepID=A0A6V7UQQ5_MELEN|nr:unnamed protein product [Meloidogyne enterolobii]